MLLCLSLAIDSNYALKLRVEKCANSASLKRHQFHLSEETSLSSHWFTFIHPLSFTIWKSISLILSLIFTLGKVESLSCSPYLSLHMPLWYPQSLKSFLFSLWQFYPTFFPELQSVTHFSHPLALLGFIDA